MCPMCGARSPGGPSGASPAGCGSSDREDAAPAICSYEILYGLPVQPTPVVWNFLCQQHCESCNWRYSGATCDWWFSVKVLTPLYDLLPFQVGILSSNQPWVPRRCRCAKWNVIQLTDPDRTWRHIHSHSNVCVCVMIKSCPRCLAISAGKRFGTSSTNLNMCKCNSDVCAHVRIQQLRRFTPNLTWCRWTKRNASFTTLNKSSHSTSTDRAGRRKTSRSWEPIFFIA